MQPVVVVRRVDPLVGYDRLRSERLDFAVGCAPGTLADTNEVR
jgi:hypothetical protein